MRLLVRAPEDDEWVLVRTVRLAALADAPDAFGSTLAAERDLPERVWRQRLPSNLLAFDDDDDDDDDDDERRGLVMGLVGCYVDPVAPRHLELVAMWVAPGSRRCGVGEALVSAILDRGRVTGARQVRLWVTEGNDAARRLYERCGFIPTGERAPLPSNPALSEIRMVRTLR